MNAEVTETNILYFILFNKKFQEDYLFFEPHIRLLYLINCFNYRAQTITRKKKEKSKHLREKVFQIPRNVRRNLSISDLLKTNRAEKIPRNKPPKTNFPKTNLLRRNFSISNLIRTKKNVSLNLVSHSQVFLKRTSRTSSYIVSGRISETHTCPTCGIKLMCRNILLYHRLILGHWKNTTM